ncbi:MAG: hypothetical protein ACPH97_04715, partial [Flavobacteriales bacterium]
GLVISVLLYVVRLILLRAMRQTPLSPLLYIAPRGLITVLLFFAIESQHAELVFAGFDQGVLLVVILATSLVMTAALIQHGSGIQPVADHDIGALPNAPRPSVPVLSGGDDDGANAAGPATVRGGDEASADVTRGGTPGPAGDESSPEPQG